MLQPVKQRIEQLKKARGAPDMYTALKACQGLEPHKPGELLALHDLLLGICAWPPDIKTYYAARQELERLAIFSINKAATANPAFVRAIEGSGIAGSTQQYSFSLALADWFATRMQTIAGLAGCDAAPELVHQLLQMARPEAEFVAGTQGEYSLGERIQLLTGEKAAAWQLAWLTDTVKNLFGEERKAELLYQSLQVYIQLQLNDANYSRTLLQLPGVKPVVYNPGKKDIGISLRKIKLTLPQQQVVANTIRLSLALYGRETDPFSFIDEEHLSLFDAGNGLQIALAELLPGRRLSLETYVGYMVFANGIPVAYGGGWIWARRCKIGINIYPPFRRGGSAVLFQSVLALYRQQFGVSRFVIRPYQFGKGNPEGIKSGAFWFYYKLGFRPVYQKHFAIAEAEAAWIATNPYYRSPASVLRKLTGSDLAWQADPAVAPVNGAECWSRAITAHIRDHYNGDARAALKGANVLAQQLFPKAELRDWHRLPAAITNNWLLLVLMLPQLAHLSAAAKHKFLQLAVLKFRGTSSEYNRALIRANWFWQQTDELPAAE